MKQKVLSRGILVAIALSVLLGLFIGLGGGNNYYEGDLYELGKTMSEVSYNNYFELNDLLDDANLANCRPGQLGALKGQLGAIYAMNVNQKNEGVEFKERLYHLGESLNDVSRDNFDALCNLLTDENLTNCPAGQLGKLKGQLGALRGAEAAELARNLSR